MNTCSPWTRYPTANVSIMNRVGSSLSKGEIATRLWRGCILSIQPDYIAMYNSPLVCWDHLVTFFL